MKLKCLIPVAKEFPLDNDFWGLPENLSGSELNDTMRELVKEDILGFIEELGGIDVLLDIMEFYYD